MDKENFTDLYVFCCTGKWTINQGLPLTEHSFESFIGMKYMQIFVKDFNFSDGVLCKSCIYKCNEGIDRKIYTTFIKDCVLTEYI